MFREAHQIIATMYPGADTTAAAIPQQTLRSTFVVIKIPSRGSAARRYNSLAVA
jgi:hypothetical protein